LDDRRAANGIMSVIRHGLRWPGAPPADGSDTTCPSASFASSPLSIFDRIFFALAAEDGPPGRRMIDSTQRKAPHSAAGLLHPGAYPSCIGSITGCLKFAFHAACDQRGRPVLLPIAEKASDHRGAAAILPKA